MLGSNRLERWKSQWYPDRYHGHGRNKSFFEGWYFKMVSEDGSIAMSVIPGISMDEHGKKHAFIQVIDGTKAISSYHEFDFEEFESKKDQFGVNIAGNTFSVDHLSLDLPGLKGSIKMEDHVPWPKSLGAPGIMGWYSFVPFMQCYHGVLSMHHRLSGSLEVSGTHHSFDNGIGYIEKDWGTSFPKSWIWCHSNHFEPKAKKISLLASVAHIPWMGSYFVGFLVGVRIEDTLYQFTTYNGSRHTGSIDESNVYLEFTKGDLSLTLKATKAKTAELISPISGGMRGKVNESIDATVEIVLSKSETVIYKGVGKHTGLEIAGDIDVLLKN